MGYMRHHGIFVTTYKEGLAQQSHKQACSIFGCDLVSEVRESIVNGYFSFAVFSFAVFPDGSKEGWGDSDKGDADRAAFVAWLRKQPAEERSYDWVEVQYGDDDQETCIVNDSDHGDEPVIVDAISYLPAAKE